MKNSRKCIKCGSDKIIADIRVVDHGYYDTKHDLAVEIQKNPGAKIIKRYLKGPLHAWICGDCGYTELYADNAAELWEKHIAEQQS